MSSAKPALKQEPEAKAEPESVATSRRAPATSSGEIPQRLPNALAGAETQKRPVASAPPKQSPRQNHFSFQPRVPVLQGEATYHGWLPVDGIVSGQLGASGNTLIIKQRPKCGSTEPGPELDGEITFRDMLRVNGHIAGKVFSTKGTLIVDASARVDACIDVAVAIISGTVNGDVVGRERVEVTAGAVVNGNISTPSLSMRPGVVFSGDCRLLQNEDNNK